MSDLTPCIICEKAVIYYAPLTKTLDSASSIIIDSKYGSNFESHQYTGIICDDCLDHLIQSNKVLAHP